MSLPLAGGTPIVLVPSGAQGIAIDATNLYWTDWTLGVLKEPLAGGTPTTIVSVEGSQDALVVDATSVYWTGGNGSGDISKAPLAGGTPTTLAPSQFGSYSIAVNATSVYWQENGTGTVKRLGICQSDVCQGGPGELHRPC